ncbi:hypothetical protein Q8A67_021754 [Cirrhinus molitorella]|uniref:Uncharacterized protein n=1 Tax=Cirrhinus molitorella TaxID=172907 RepID=A0AA88TEQ9_9TELE|nr:hypothetical protein Q8A67_021754 [Cirrhinus molitorella]
MNVPCTGRDQRPCVRLHRDAGLYELTRARSTESESTDEHTDGKSTDGHYLRIRRTRNTVGGAFCNSLTTSAM